MSRRSVIALAIFLSAILLAVGLQWRRYSAAKGQLAAVISEHRQAIENVREIADLRARSERVSLQARPTQDVIARVHAALAEAGLPPDRFAELRNDSDSALSNSGGRSGGGDTAAGPNYRLQSLSLSLHQLSVADFGGFIDAWSRANPAWTVTRLTLAHDRSSANLQSDLYDITLILSAIYLGEA